MKKYGGAFLAVVLIVTLSAGCGGGGGSSASPAPATQTPSGTAATLSGTAAAGAPIIGTITVQDSSTPAITKQTNILANGKYSIDVSGMTGPFMLRADGAVDTTEVHLYSAAVQADVGGIINVTPFTDLIFANIAGTLAKTYFDNQGYKNLTADAIQTNSALLKASILPVLQALGMNDTIDLLRISFSADNTGFDRVMDIVKVTVDPTSEVATIKNIITGQQITDDLKTQSYLGTLDNVTGLDELAQIENQLKKFSALFAVSVPQPDNPELLALFDQQGFLEQGKNLTAFLSEITSSSDVVGVQFANLEVKSLQTDTAQIAFNALGKNGNNINNGDKIYWQVIKINNVWLFQGDQTIGEVSVDTFALYDPVGNSFESNLDLQVRDNGNLFDTATVTGPGINGTITLNKSITADTFRLSGSYPFIPMNDTLVDSIQDSGASYEFKLYSGSVLKATYIATLSKRPYKLSELSAYMFPVISPATDAALSAFNGGSLTVSWTMPSGLKPNSLDVYLLDNNGNENSVSYDLYSTTATSLTATLEAKTASGQSFTPTYRVIHVSGVDIFGRSLLTDLWR